MHKLLQSSDTVFLSFVEALLKAEGIDYEMTPSASVHPFGEGMIFVAQEDKFLAEKVLETAKAEREK